MTFVGGAMIAVGTVFLALYLKSQQKEIAALLTAAGTIVLFLAALRQGSDAIAMIRDMAAHSDISSEAEILIKALGAAAAAQITADICREAGEPTVAGQVEMIGKTEILLLSLPMAAQLLSLAQDLLS